MIPKITRGLTAIALALVFGGAAAWAAPPAPVNSQSPLRRFALVMGANGGGEGLQKLRYAASDARSFGTVLTELGGVSEADLVILLEPGIAAFRGAAERIRAQAASATAAGQRCELIVYYSGHSDDEGLLLGKEKLGYSDLRSSIERVPASVRVAILDSCSSGSLTRTKGGSVRPAFLFDTSSDMEGHAYITSSSEAEAAQESDKIGGSFFTHYFVSALRGAADVNGEGRVTLNEAYAYAFRETLASTENTQYGPQHPAYEINLTGSGDLVLSDLRSSKAGLSLDEALSGAFYVRDSKGNLAVELDKAAGDRVEIGLPPGKYSVSQIQGAARSQADVVVPENGRARLVQGNFKYVAAEVATARGVEVVPADAAPRPVENDSPADRAIAKLQRPVVRTGRVGHFPISVDMTILPDWTHGYFTSEEDKVISFNLFWGQARNHNGVQLSTLVNLDSGDMGGFQFAVLGNAVQGKAGGVQFAPLSNAALGGFGGWQLAALLNWAGGESGGLQLGAVNVASRISGVQLGAVNVADRLSGVQLGVVNIANRIDGIPLGLVNIEKGGVSMPQAWMESTDGFRLGYSFGTRIIYNILSLGIDRADATLVRPSTGVGIGARLTIGPFFGDADFSWRAVYGIENAPVSQRFTIRALAGFPAKKAGFITGIALEGFMPSLSRENDGSAVSAFRVEPRFLFGIKL